MEASLVHGKNLSPGKSLIRAMRSFMASLLSSQTTSLEENLSLTVPTNIFIRSQLLCEYISDQVGVNFGLNNFLMVLYLDFINESVKKYKPKEVLKTLTQRLPVDKIKISNGTEMYECSPYKQNTTEILISMVKKDACKGKIVLAELKELYGYQISLDRMLTVIWIEFIEKYKKGDNNKALNNIIKMLQKQN